MKWVILLNFLLIGGLYYKQHSDYKETKLSNRMALYSAYCNRYNIRALQPYGGSPGSYPKVKSVIFPEVCITQESLDFLHAVKYRNYETKDFYLGGYDSYYTGRHYDEETIKKHKAYNREIAKEIEALIE